MKKVWLACLIATVMTAFTSCTAIPFQSLKMESSVAESSIATEESFEEETEEPSQKPFEETATELAVGDSAALEDWEISVTAWEVVSEIRDSTGFMVFTPEEGNQYIVVSTIVTNNGNTADVFLPSFSMYHDVSAKIYYNHEYEYSATRLLGEKNDLHDSHLNPLTNKSGTIVYDVPPAVTEGTEPLSITFEAGTDSITFKLR